MCTARDTHAIQCTTVLNPFALDQRPAQMFFTLSFNTLDLTLFWGADMNAVYDWPFDAAHAGGNSVDVLDIHGNPHTEQCDPGIFPSFFLDYGRLAGRQAFLNAVEKYIVNGTADGVYLDCYTTIPLK